MTAMSRPKCKPIQFFLYGPAELATSSPTSHLPAVHTPVVQSALLSQLGAVSHTPPSQSRPVLHSVEFSHLPPQSTSPRLAPPPPQPGKSGGHPAESAQRHGAVSPASAAGPRATVMP